MQQESTRLGSKNVAHLIRTVGRHGLRRLLNGAELATGARYGEWLLSFENFPSDEACQTDGRSQQDFFCVHDVFTLFEIVLGHCGDRASFEAFHALHGGQDSCAFAV